MWGWAPHRGPPKWPTSGIPSTSNFPERVATLGRKSGWLGSIPWACYSPCWRWECRERLLRTAARQSRTHEPEKAKSTKFVMWLKIGYCINDLFMFVPNNGRALCLYFCSLVSDVWEKTISRYNKFVGGKFCFRVFTTITVFRLSSNLANSIPGSCRVCRTCGFEKSSWSRPAARKFK